MSDEVSKKNPQIKWATPSHSGLSTRSREANEQKTTGRRTSLDRRTGEKARKKQENKPKNVPCIHKRRTGPTNNGPKAERMPHNHILTKANESGCEKLRAYKSSPRGQCLGERGHSQPVRPFNETQVMGQRLARQATLPLRTTPGSRKKIG